MPDVPTFPAPPSRRLGGEMTSVSGNPQAPVSVLPSLAASRRAAAPLKEDLPLPLPSSARANRWRASPSRRAAKKPRAIQIGGAGTYAVILRSRPAPLGLAATYPRTPAPTAVVDDPLVTVCRQPAIPPATPGAGLAGLWVIQPTSVVGYRAHEKFEQLPSPHEAVARTERVNGWLLVADRGGAAKIETGCIAVELASLQSVDELPGFNTADRDKSARDFLNARAHPFAIFQPYPSPINPELSRGAPIHVQISGVLEVNGVSKLADFGFDVRLSGGQAAVAGNTTVAVEDYGIEVPQGAAGFVSVDPRVTLEISIVLLKR